MASLSEEPGQPKPDQVAAGSRYVVGMTIVLGLLLLAALSLLVVLEVQ